ncbi:hypothetical protein GCM10010411_86130 [Actinomadura fulvescens]|uniref:Uncharacterized protein n=1 Tax=Actinomadura fulvescens TaxID=46160 RepID=A0ABP6D2S5_9ACTN
MFAQERIAISAPSPDPDLTGAWAGLAARGRTQRRVGGPSGAWAGLAARGGPSGAWRA